MLSNSFYKEQILNLNLEKLNKDLDSLGWSEKNSAGIRQKIIDSEKKTLTLIL